MEDRKRLLERGRPGAISPQIEERIEKLN